MIYRLFQNELLFKILFFICLVCIEFLATTTIQIEVVESVWDKLNHFVAFLVLYILISLGFRNFITIKKILLLLLFAVQIEIVQHFIDGRFFSLLDVVADFIGIVLGVLLYRLYLNTIPKLIKP